MVTCGVNRLIPAVAQRHIDAAEIEQGAERVNVLILQGRKGRVGARRQDTEQVGQAAKACGGAEGAVAIGVRSAGAVERLHRGDVGRAQPGTNTLVVDIHYRGGGWYCRAGRRHGRPRGVAR